MNVRAFFIVVSLFSAIFTYKPGEAAQGQGEIDALAAYQALRAFTLDGGSAAVDNLVLKRDRAVMTFTGTFYFPKPVLGKTCGAVFIGEGTFHAESPPSEFEKENLRRMINADLVESDFQTAVLRFTDDTFTVIGQSHESAGEAPKEAQDRALEIQPRMARETGANLASRILISLLNSESPGVFFAQFDKGSRGRFTYMLDMQCRIPTANFRINGGEKGLIFDYNRAFSTNDVWMAFYSEKDYETKTASYSDIFDQVEILHYDLEIDLREPKKSLKVKAKMDMRALASIQAVSFSLTESLPETFSYRKKKGMRVTSARLPDGTPLQTIQEEWEGGFVVLFPSPYKAGNQFSIEADVEGDFIRDLESTIDCHYPYVNGEWYPRHGYLSRSTFDFTFIHEKKYRAAAPGVRIKEEPLGDDQNAVITMYRVSEPIALVTFALGKFDLHKEQRKLNDGELPIEFFSLTHRDVTLKEDFVMAEMGNAIDFFNVMFGRYPYPALRAFLHPFSYGQGFPTMLALPPADVSHWRTFSFIAHETAHQWWGDLVEWRSYRDQWLSEGFAEYSGILYINHRTQNPGNVKKAVKELRDSLKQRPETEGGMGSKRVVDIGPLILGHRLSTKESLNAYSILTYNKGALVLRMLHFLFTDPESGGGQAFFDMMKDFVDRYRNGAASTEQFVDVANQHFVGTPIARTFGFKDLNWFFAQWVWQTALPKYKLEYSVENGPEGSFLLQGTVFQENAPENWGMPLPLKIKFSKDQFARAIILANGPQNPVNIRLPLKPESVELDPDNWVLSDDTSTKKK